METIVRNPVTDVYSTDGDWVHGLEVRGAERFLFVSGTMGLDESGAAGATIEEQLDLVWRNLRAILASADMSVDNIVRLTSYLRDRSYAGANAAARCAALGMRRIPTTAIVVETLETEWLVEIEIIAAA